MAGALLLTTLAPGGAGYARAASAALARTAAAMAPQTLPGSPGTAQAPTVVYSEDFENGQGNVPIRLTKYTGAAGATYTANHAWLQNCNGWIAAFIDPPGKDSAVKAPVADCTPKGSTGTAGPAAWNNVRILARALGILNGSADPSANHAVSAYTNGPISNGGPGAGKVEFQTVNPIPVTANGRYLTFSVNVAELSCAAKKNHALLNFFLVNGTITIPFTTAPLDPCTSGGTKVGPGIFAGTFTGNDPVLFFGTSLGIQMINEQGSGDGNEHAFDDMRVLDVTPQLDKSFSPAIAQVGGTSTLTFTITNTSDLLAKNGWSFTDTLPAGLTVASPSAAATTCPAGDVTAAAAAGSVSVAGGALNAGEASCTVTVNVTSGTKGTYTNDGSGITASTGLNPPGPASVTFTSSAVIDLTKSVSPTWFSAAGQTLTYSFDVTNPSAVTLSNITVNDTTLPGLTPVACPQPVLGPGKSERCTATYLTTAADVAAGSIDNVATAQGDPPASTTPIVTPQSDVVVPARAHPAITVRETAVPATLSEVGRVITYKYKVTNTGDVTLSHVAVKDGLRGFSAIHCAASVLAVGAAETCTATYQVTSADMAAGSVTNSAVAVGTPPGPGHPASSARSTAIILEEVPVTG